MPLNRVSWLVQSFSTYFDYQADSFGLVKKNVTLDKTLTVMGSILYNNSATSFYQVIIRLNPLPFFIDTPFEYMNNSIARNILINQPFSVDLSSSKATDPAYQNSLYFKVACPISIFNGSKTLYDKLCVISSGRFSLRTTLDQNLVITYGKIYMFNFTIGISGTNVTRFVRINTTFF